MYLNLHTSIPQHYASVLKLPYLNHLYASVPKLPYFHTQTIHSASQCPKVCILPYSNHHYASVLKLPYSNHLYASVLKPKYFHT